MPGLLQPGTLRNLRIKRVALVDNGANFDRSTGDGAHIMLFKRDLDKSMPLGSVHIDVPLGDKPKDKDDEKENPVKKSFMSKLLGLVTETDVEKRKLVAAELEKEFPPDDKDEKPVHKSGDAMCKCADCVSMRASKLDKIAVDEIAKEATEKAAQEAAEKAKMPADMQKRFDTLAAENVELRKSATEAITLAKVEREARLDNEMREVLKGFKATPFDLDKDVAEFRKMKEANPTMFERTMAIFKAQDAQLEASAAFSSFGTRKGSGEGSAWAQIEAKADALVEKSTAGLTREQAIDKVLIDPKNNKLIKQYREEAQ